MLTAVYIVGFVAALAAWYRQGVKDGYSQGYRRGVVDASMKYIQSIEEKNNAE